MGERYFTVEQFTNNRKNKPEYRVNIWKYETVCICYPPLQRFNAESAKLKFNTFDHAFFPQNLDQKFVQIVKICD